MKSTLTALIILIFAAIAVLAAFAMNHGEQAHANCIASIVNGVPCPHENSEPLASAMFHLNAAKGFSTATIGSFTANLLLLAFAFAYALRSIANLRRSSPQQISFLKSHEEQPPPIGEPIRYWLALHENSPSAT